MKPSHLRLSCAAVLFAIFPLGTCGPKRTPLPSGPAEKEAGAGGSILALASGEQHTCVVLLGGRVECWGYNRYGQLGNGTVESRRTPEEVEGLEKGVIGISAGRGHTCAVLESGGVRCWGHNNRGQLGDGTTQDASTPVEVKGLEEGAVAAAAGTTHTCALLKTGSVKCWGSYKRGSSGPDITKPGERPALIAGLGGAVKAVSAGERHACALLGTGSVKCWGFKSWPLDLIPGNTGLVPVEVSGLGSAASAVALGDAFACVLVKGGSVKCWGDNAMGQLGNGTTRESRVPEKPAELGESAAAIDVSWGHACAVTKTGRLLCWGNNASGQLGTGSMEDLHRPERITGLGGRAELVSTGAFHTCAALDTGAVECWGSNAQGQLGNGSTDIKEKPARIAGISSGAAAATAGEKHTCALLNTGEVKCWGGNTFGQLGNGTNKFSSGPVTPKGLGNGAAAVAAGHSFTCVLLETGGVKCWGRNGSGQLGNATTEDSRVPADVSGLSAGVSDIAAGREHACALLETGGVQCWGNNLAGSLGDGSGKNQSTPAPVNGLESGVLMITAGSYHTCALLKKGKVKCWGANGSGQAGDWTLDDKSKPVSVKGLKGSVIAVAAGAEHTCALLQTGDVKCWGNGPLGRCSTGIKELVLKPERVTGLRSGVIAIEAGYGYTCGVLASGGIECWGGEEECEACDGSLESVYVPVDAAASKGRASTIAVGADHICAALKEAGIACWGSDEQGQVSGVFSGYPGPVAIQAPAY